MVITEEGISMSEESKKKAGLPGKKVMDLFSIDFHQGNNKFWVMTRTEDIF